MRVIGSGNSCSQPLLPARPSVKREVRVELQFEPAPAAARPRRAEQRQRRRRERRAAGAAGAGPCHAPGAQHVVPRGLERRRAGVERQAGRPRRAQVVPRRGSCSAPAAAVAGGGRRRRPWPRRPPRQRAGSPSAAAQSTSTSSRPRVSNSGWITGCCTANSPFGSAASLQHSNGWLAGASTSASFAVSSRRSFSETMNGTFASASANVTRGRRVVDRVGAGDDQHLAPCRRASRRRAPPAPRRRRPARSAAAVSSNSPASNAPSVTLSSSAASSIAGPDADALAEPPATHDAPCPPPPASSSASAFSTAAVDAGLLARPCRSRTAPAPARPPRLPASGPSLRTTISSCASAAPTAREVRVAHADAPVGVGAGQREPAFELDEAAHLARRRAGRASGAPRSRARDRRRDDRGTRRRARRRRSALSSRGRATRASPKACFHACAAASPASGDHTTCRSPVCAVSGRRSPRPRAGLLTGPVSSTAFGAGRLQPRDHVGADGDPGRRHRRAAARAAPRPGRARGPGRRGPSAPRDGATLRPRPLASSALGVTRMGRPSRVRTSTGVPSSTVWKKRAGPRPSTRLSGMSWNGTVASCGTWQPALASAPAAASVPLRRRNSRRSRPGAVWRREGLVGVHRRLPHR